MLFAKIDRWIENDVLRQHQGISNGAWAGFAKFFGLVIALLVGSEVLFYTGLIDLPVEVLAIVPLLLLALYWIRFYVHKTRAEPAPPPQQKRRHLFGSAGRFALMSLGSLLTFPFVVYPILPWTPYVGILCMVLFFAAISLGIFKNAPRWNVLALVPALFVSILYVYSLWSEASLALPVPFAAILLTLVAASGLSFLYFEAREIRNETQARKAGQ